jgi:hypothetical protein
VLNTAGLQVLWQEWTWSCPPVLLSVSFNWNAIFLQLLTDLGGGNLTQAVRNGSIPEARLDDMVSRVMAPYFFLEQNSPSYPALGIGMPANPLLPHTLVDARVEEARPVLMQSAIEGHVLVKNTNNALPLKKPRVLSLFGYDAVAPDLNTPGFREVSSFASIPSSLAVN